MEVTWDVVSAVIATGLLTARGSVLLGVKGEGAELWAGLPNVGEEVRAALAAQHRGAEEPQTSTRLWNILLCNWSISSHVCACVYMCRCAHVRASVLGSRRCRQPVGRRRPEEPPRHGCQRDWPTPSLIHALLR